MFISFGAIADSINISELYERFSKIPREGREIDEGTGVEGIVFQSVTPPRSCNYPKLMELTKIRALYILFYKDNRSDINLLKDINISNIKSSEWDSISASVLQMISKEKLNLKLLLNTLVSYHDKIISTQDWESKLVSFKSKNQYSNTFGYDGKDFYAVGFSKDPCFSSSRTVVNTDFGLRYSDLEMNLELAIYSFWYRRYMDGSMAAIYKFFSSIDKLI
jgi:hypothetical protein